MIGFLELLFIIVAAVGLTNIVVDSSMSDMLIKNRLRRIALKDDGNPREDKPVSNFFLDMMSCYMCSGFWCGIIVALMYSGTFLPWMKWIFILLFGFVCSFASMFGYYVFSYLEKK